MHYIIKKLKPGTDPVAVYNGKHVSPNVVRTLVKQDVQKIQKQVRYN